jgi:hypothetical protein
MLTMPEGNEKETVNLMNKYFSYTSLCRNTDNCRIKRKEEEEQYKLK